MTPDGERETEQGVEKAGMQRLDDGAGRGAHDPPLAGGGPARGVGDADDEEVPEGLKRFFGGSWKETSRYADAATALFGGILGLGLLGWALDVWRGTRPVGLLLGMLLGGVIGFYRLGRVMLGPR